MKKLLVLALSVIMVLAFGVASYASTVTVGGELNFGKTWNEKGDGYGGLTPQKASEANVSNAKVTITAQIADDTKAFTALKVDPTTTGSFNCDEAWVQFTEDYGTIKVGYFGYNQNQKDIIDGVIPDIKSGLTVSYTAKLTDQLTLNLAAANDGTAGIGKNPWQWFLPPLPSAHGLDYSVGLAYDTDSFGINANYFKFTGLGIPGLPLNDRFTAFSIMGYIKMDDLKFYAQYDNNNAWQWISPFGGGIGVQNFIIGAVYDSADFPLFVRAEYDLNDQHTTSNEWALRLAYKMTPNVKFQYTLMRHNYINAGFNILTGFTNMDNYTTNELLLNVTF